MNRLIGGLFIAGLFIVVGAFGGGVAYATTPPPSIYSKPANWLCRPGLARDACRVNLDTTVFTAEGMQAVEHFFPAKNPKVDCFYVYPTVSADDAANSDLVPGPEERAAVQNQFARLGSVCRLFAPMYRQSTLRSLFSRIATGGTAATGKSPTDIAFADVLAAWDYYLAHDNHGRGVILVGHSQGSRHLDALIRARIDNNTKVRSRVIAAYLIGWGVNVPAGKDVGGDFKHVPLCRRATQLGCVVAYSTFRSTAPPPADSYFGRSAARGQTVACTNPAALDEPASSTPLGEYLATSTVRWVRPLVHPTVDTPFVRVPGLLSARCVDQNGFTYLEVKVQPTGPVRDIGGDLTPPWGLHLVDVNIALRNLIGIAHNQSQVYLSATSRRRT